MPKSLTVVYAGTPAFAVPALDALLQAGYHVAAIYTQLDRPAGRGRQLQSSQVKQFALTQRIPVYQPVSLRDAEAQRALAALRPDLMIVTAYGLLLPSEVLALPRLGCVNIHASLLPRWRGAAPIQRAILAGDSETGITLMQMDVGLDTGDILWQRTLPIIPGENAQQLHDRLAQLGAQCLLDALPELAAGSLLRRQQAAAQVSYAAKLRKEEAWLDWRQAAEQLARQVCAFNPWPVAQTGIPKTSGCAEVLRIWQAEALPHPSHALPGTVLAATKTGVDVACGQGVLRLQCLQRAGGRPQAAAEFINACDLRDICLVSEG